MPIWMVLVAISMPPEIEVVGRLMLADVICIVVFIWAIIRGDRNLFRPVEIMFYKLIAVWFVAQVLTDIYVGSDPADYLRGWASIIFFVIDYAAVRLVAGRDLDRAVLFLLLVLLASALKFYLGSGNIEKTGELALDWKFGYGAAFTLLVMYIGAKTQRILGIDLLGAVATLAAAAVSLALDARSLFGQAAFAALVGPVAVARGTKPISPLALALLLVLSIGGGLGAVEVYSFAASEGFLGQAAKDKYERQVDNDLGLLLSGRTELLGSLDAIADSPVVGYGSYAHDIHFALLRYIRLERAGITPHGDIDSDRIPTHSFLFGAWVQAGILGAVFWLWVLYTTARGVLRAVERPNLYTSIIIFSGIALAWDVLFSPFGLDRRIVTPALLNIMLIAIANSEVSVQRLKAASLVRPRWQRQTATSHGLDGEPPSGAPGRSIVRRDQ